MSDFFDKLQGWMESKENEHLEFKEAKNNFHFEKLTQYCTALANEGGGRIILGVTDKQPRKVVGSQAFEDLQRTKSGLIDRLHLRIEIFEYLHREGRVLVFEIPSRPIGRPIEYQGAYWMRSGEELKPMTPDMLKRIFDEGGPDFSAEICPQASMTDLDKHAIDRFRAMWERKSGNPAFAKYSSEQLLSDAELIRGGLLTYAALILFGTHNALGKYLGQGEVIFEYRSTETSIAYHQRKEYRQGFFLFQNDLWNAINLRNDTQHFQDGLFIWDIPTFNEAVIREAILNAICHRDYRLAGSIFIRQFPQRLEIISPGGFPPGINADNLLWRQFPRNRRLAEAFARCGLVERSGQGANRMFEECIKESKPIPDFSGTDDYQVAVTLQGEIQDPVFLRFLEQVHREKKVLFSTNDLLVLDLINNERPIIETVKSSIPKLMEQGIIERIGRGKGTRYILSRQFHTFLGKKGLYTRKRGLDRETNKALLLKHIGDNEKDGSRLQELIQVLPALSRNQVQLLLKELKAEQKILSIGRTNGARWYSKLNEKAIKRNS